MFTIHRIKKQNYIHSDDVFNTAPFFCKGARTSRELIKKHKMIETDDYIFGKPSKKTEDKWISADCSSIKFDQR